MTSLGQGVAGNPAIVDYLLPTASLLSVAIFGYIANAIRRYLKGHSDDHKWLDDQVAENTRAIRAMLEQRERMIERLPPLAAHEDDR